MYPSDPAPVEEHRPSAPPLSDPIRDRAGSVGSTPLLRLHRIHGSRSSPAEFWVKAEFLNPTGSVKDRAAEGIVRSAFATGQLAPGRTLLDASSGNTGISFAMLGARLGFPVAICLPRNASPERVYALRSLGATVLFTDPIDGTDGAQREARRLALEAPDVYFYADQYNHPSNPDAHFRGTGPEIWEQTRHRVTHLVAGVGTGGTITGTGRFLKLVAPKVRVLGVQPTGPMHGLEGLKHIPTALRPGTYDDRVVDETIRVETEEAQAVRRALAKEEGLFVGTSSGAALAAALTVNYPPDAVAVVILPDGGERYRSDPYWEASP